VPHYIADVYSGLKLELQAAKWHLSEVDIPLLELRMIGQSID
jgi:hypothetical protein